MVHAAAASGISVGPTALPSGSTNADKRPGSPLLQEVFVYLVKRSLSLSSPTRYPLTYALLLVIAG